MGHTAHNHTMAGNGGEGPRVEAIGPLLMGQEKWLGGVCSPDGEYIYGVPGHATRVVRVTVKTGEVTLIGPEYFGHHKWLRGVSVPPKFTGPEHPQGLCYCLPSNYPAVLQIDPATQVRLGSRIVRVSWHIALESVVCAAVHGCRSHGTQKTLTMRAEVERTHARATQPYARVLFWPCSGGCYRGIYSCAHSALHAIRLTDADRWV